MKRIMITTALLGAAACGDEVLPSAICTAEIRNSFKIVVVDSASGDGRAAGSTVVLQDGAYRDSTARPAAAPVASDSVFYPMNTYERPGTYTVRVRRPGYALWERQNVQVTADECHVQTVRVQARLQPAP